MAYYLGIDIGGTRIKAVLLTGTEKQSVLLQTVATPSDRPSVAAALEALAADVCGGKELAGIGIGIAGVVDSETGVIEKAPNIPWVDGWRIADVWRAQQIPVIVENDARCFLYAESLWGAARGVRHAVGIAVGTGIGGAAIIDGHIYRGAHGAAGEFGHMILEFDPEDVHASRTVEQLGGREAYEQRGDRSDVIGAAAANLVNAFDPEIVVLGGGGVTNGSIHIDAVRNAVQHFAISREGKKTPVVPAALGDASQAIGAALFAAQSRYK